MSLVSCQKEVVKTSKPKNTKNDVEKLIGLANGFYNKREFDSAFFFYNKAKFISNPISDSENYVNALNQMAVIQQEHDDYIGSQNTILNAIPSFPFIKKTALLWNSYTIIANNYQNTFDYKNALRYYNYALNLKTTESETQFVKNKIARVYIEQNKFNDALEILFSLLKDLEINGTPKDYAGTLDNVGFCYYKLKNPKALSYLDDALKIRSEIHNNSGIATSYYHLGLFYQIKNPSLAKKYMQLSYDKFSPADEINERILALKFLIQNSAGADLKKHSVLYVNLIDSLFEVKQKAKNHYAKIKYDSKKEKRENLKLKTYKVENELQLERQKNRNILSYIIIGIILILIIILYFYLTSRGNKEKIEATYKSETRIAKKLHDELANDIYHTMAFAENRNLALAENRKQLLYNLDAIYSRTRDIAKENNPIITNENYVFYLREMLSRFNTSDVNLILNGLDAVLWSNIEKNKKITLYRILQELLVNMKKHSNATLVGITFETFEKNILVNYADNGKGVNLNDITFKNGLNNVENRILKIKGQIDIDSAPDKGFKVFLKFPI